MKDCLRMLSIRPIVMLLLLSFSLWSCGATYPLTVAQIEKDEEVSKRAINKKIELHTRHDEIIIGYLAEVEEDSIAINLKKNDSLIKKVAKTEIRYFNVLQDPGPALAIGVAVLFVAMVIYLHKHPISLFPDL